MKTICRACKCTIRETETPPPAGMPVNAVPHGYCQECADIACLQLDLDRELKRTDDLVAVILGRP